MSETKRKKTKEYNPSDEFILHLKMVKGTPVYLGQGFKFRYSPLQPKGWKKITTAENHALNIETIMGDFWKNKILEVKVCRREVSLVCLSSYAIPKQNLSGNEDKNGTTTRKDDD